MENYNYIEVRFLEAEKLLNENDFAAAKGLLEEILEMEPGYGRAHNHLGWLYYAKFDNYERAAYHFRLAIKFEPGYPASYINYCYLLNEINNEPELRSLAMKALEVPGVNKAVIYNELGRSSEMSGYYKDALANYKEAIRYSMNKNEIEVFNLNIERAKQKQALFAKRFLF